MSREEVIQIQAVRMPVNSVPSIASAGDKATKAGIGDGRGLLVSAASMVYTVDGTQAHRTG